MRKFLSICTILVVVSLKAQTWTTEEQYIQRFAPYAVEEMEIYKIPASITLAQGLLETAGGQSRLAQIGKNHFGIKCKKEWTGKSMSHTDDAPNECFRVYDSPRDSYRDHSLFLTERKHYGPLFRLDIKDYKAWAYGLKKAGYATSSSYANALIKKIEKYNLYEFDNATTANVNTVLLAMYPDLNNDPVFLEQNNLKKTQSVITIENPSKSTTTTPPTTKKILVVSSNASTSNTSSINNVIIKSHPNGGLKYVVIPEESNLVFISKKYSIPIQRLLKYNDLYTSELKKGQIVFLEPKKNSATQDTYTAANGETLYDVSQKFGVKLKRLYRNNRMDEGQQISAGQLVYLDSKKPRR